MEISTKKLLDKKKSIGLIHKVYNVELKNLRIFRASTKTRSEVSGGGKKPWRQKGTGNARAGSNRSSIWVGGGIAFGPKPRKIEKKINKKEKQLAIFTALLLKRSEWKILSTEVFDNLKEIKKTSDLEKYLQNNLEISKLKKKLLILPTQIKNLFLASRNIKNINIILANSLNLRSILHADILLFDENTYKIFTSYYGKSQT